VRRPTGTSLNAPIDLGYGPATLRASTNGYVAQRLGLPCVHGSDFTLHRRRTATHPRNGRTHCWLKRPVMLDMWVTGRFLSQIMPVIFRSTDMQTVLAVAVRVRVR
jgi:hypothetical protein